jgi:hypothetical protein
LGYTKRKVLINLHPLRRRRSANRWHLRVVILAVVCERRVVNVGLEALVEVVCAHARDDDGKDEEDDGECGEGSQGLLRRLVVLLAVEGGDVHADELEQEVAQGDEVDYDDGDHSGDGLATYPPSGKEQQEEGYDKGGGGECDLDFGRLVDDDEELDCEGEEEEEVELEQSNVNLGA